MEILVQYAPLLAAGGSLFALVSFFMCLGLQARLQRFARPFDELARTASKANTSDLLQAHLKGVEQNARRIDEVLAYTRHLRTQAMNAIQGHGFLRYDAFEGVRGKQSFSLCILDAHQNGFLLTSIAGRTDSRTYAKPVRAGKCETAISEEEMEAIELAKGTLTEVHEPVLAGV